MVGWYNLMKKIQFKFNDRIAQNLCVSKSTFYTILKLLNHPNQVLSKKSGCGPIGFDSINGMNRPRQWPIESGSKHHRDSRIGKDQRTFLFRFFFVSTKRIGNLYRSTEMVSAVRISTNVVLRFPSRAFFS